MTVVIVHDSCNDGLTAGWILQRALHDPVILQAEYKDDPPLEACKGEDVILADVTWDVDDMMDLLNVAQSVQIYDHHRTAMRLKDAPGITEHKNLKRLVLDESRSAARIIWDEFGDDAQLRLQHKFRDVPPKMVQHVEDRDLWRNEIEHTPEVTEWLYTFPRTIEAFDRAYKLLEFDYDLAVGMGEQILDLKEETSKALRQYSKLTKLDGHQVRVVRGYSRLSSILGNLLAQDSPDGVGACWWPSDGGFKLSFRSLDDGPNVADMAEDHFGGGGHANAAGAWVEAVPSGWS